MPKKDSSDFDHKFHRQRQKKKFLSAGLNAFSQVEVMELLLFFAIPQGDVKAVAYDLIERFGSVSGVLNAEYDELITVPGIKEHSATLLKVLPAISRYYASESGEKFEKLDTVDKVGQFFVNKYIGVNKETVYLMLLDNKFKLIECAKMYEGSVNSAQITPRSLIEKALFKHAPIAILAHNHPGGLAIPTSDDINTTRNLEAAFDLIGVKFLEHIVVAGDKFTPVLIRNNNMLRAGAYENFYSSYNLD